VRVPQGVQVRFLSWALAIPVIV